MMYRRLRIIEAMMIVVGVIGMMVGLLMMLAGWK